MEGGGGGGYGGGWRWFCLYQGLGFPVGIRLKQCYLWMDQDLGQVLNMIMVFYIECWGMKGLMVVVRFYECGKQGWEFCYLMLQMDQKDRVCSEFGREFL